MDKKIALIISSLFHPVFINTLSLGLLLNLHPVMQVVMPANLKWFYISFYFVVSAFIPSLVIYILKWRGSVSSIQLKHSSERRIPFIITSILLLFTYYLFQKINTSSSIQVFILLCTSLVVSMMIINEYTKISIHMTSMGLLCGIIVSFSQYSDIRLFLLVAIVVSGMVASARLFADSHTIKQLGYGFTLGFCYTILFY
jgi:hypothetical protein